MMLRDVYLKVNKILSPYAFKLLKFNYTLTYLRKGKMMKYELLLVDDEVSILESLAEWLTDDDVNVTKARNGKEGLALLKEKKFDVVVSDISMPAMSGIMMFSEAKAAGIFTPIIFFSAHVESELIHTLKFAGATAVVQKPHNERLSVEINNVLVRRELLVPFSGMELS
jgi:CheY-like chemotaxis protein